jgi:hypothetical protein
LKIKQLFLGERDSEKQSFPGNAQDKVILALRRLFAPP